MAEKKERFVVVYKKNTFNTLTKVLVDKETGVNYVFHQDGQSGGLTVLLDRDGKPIVTPIYDENFK